MSNFRLVSCHKTLLMGTSPIGWGVVLKGCPAHGLGESFRNSKAATNITPLALRTWVHLSSGSGLDAFTSSVACTRLQGSLMDRPRVSYLGPQSWGMLLSWILSTMSLACFGVRFLMAAPPMAMSVLWQAGLLHTLSPGYDLGLSQALQGSFAHGFPVRRHSSFFKSLIF